MTDFDVTADGLRRLLERFPNGCHTGISERTGSQIEQPGDYWVDWELTAAPSDPAACPIQVLAARQYDLDSLWGFAFDTRERVARILGLSSATAGISIAFGTEPIEMPGPRVVSIIQSVIDGNVQLEYRTLAGRLMKTSGSVELPGAAPQRFQGVSMAIGRRRALRYAPWWSRPGLR